MIVPDDRDTLFFGVCFTSSFLFFVVDDDDDDDDKLRMSIFSHLPIPSPFNGVSVLIGLSLCTVSPPGVLSTAATGTFGLPSTVRFNGVEPPVADALSKLMGCGKIVCFSLYWGGSVRSI